MTAPGQPLLSVVVPAYNREATIDRTVASVLTQAHTDLELLVVDDGSTDATVEAARAAIAGDGRARVVPQPHAGVSATRNAGARLATGRYLAFLDSDDEVAPSWAAHFAAAVSVTDDPPALAFCAGRWRSSDGREHVVRPEGLGPASGDLVGMWHPATFVVARELFASTGGYAVALTYSENTELGLRLTRALVDDRGRTGAATASRASAEPLVTVHLPEGALTNAWSEEARFTSALYIASTHESSLRADPAQLASYWAIAGVAAARLGRPADARRLLWRAARSERSPLGIARQLERGATACIPSRRARRWPPRTAPTPRIDLP